MLYKQNSQGRPSELLQAELREKLEAEEEARRAAEKKDIADRALAEAVLKEQEIFSDLPYNQQR